MQMLVMSSVDARDALHTRNGLPCPSSFKAMTKSNRNLLKILSYQVGKQNIKLTSEQSGVESGE